MKKYRNIAFREVVAPRLMEPEAPIVLSDETMQEHLSKILLQMETKEIDAVCIYADREHGGNFGYLTGFEPRFEEAMLVLHRDGKAYLLLGNESLRMGQYSRLDAEVIHVPHFSLPNQPMETPCSFWQLVEKAGIGPDMCVAVAGWKMFTAPADESEPLFEVPYMIIQAFKKLTGTQGSVIHGGGLFIDPHQGARVINNANEIAHYEYGATLASNCVLRAMEKIQPGATELEIAAQLAAYGQPVSVQTICATGERFTKAQVAPRDKKTALGDTFALTMGLRGGLTSRSGYVAISEADLPEPVKDYLEMVVKPYYAAAVRWYETIELGIRGETLYQAIEEILPKEQFGWSLNPGHLVSSEEWMSSPIYPHSQTKIQSGMMFQMDIIPKVPGYGGVSAEDGIALADQTLRSELKENYPLVWERICERRRYMIEELGIKLKDEVLPLSNSSGYLRPYLLDHKRAMCIQKD